MSDATIRPTTHRPAGDAIFAERPFLHVLQRLEVVRPLLEFAYGVLLRAPVDAPELRHVVSDALGFVTDLAGTVRESAMTELAVALPMAPAIIETPISEASIRRHARRAVERAMTVIRGSLPFGSRASTFDREYERAHTMERILRGSPSMTRRNGDGPTGADDTSWAAEDFARRMVPMIESARIAKLITHTVICTWCEAEGVPAIMHEGNPEFPPSRAVCLRHQAALFENAGLCDGGEDLEC